MPDPISTVAAIVSFADVAVRTCKGIRAMLDSWKDFPNAIQRVRQTVQNLESVLGSLRQYVVEYQSSKLCREQHQLLPDVVKTELRDIDLDLRLLQQYLPPGAQGKARQKIKWVFDEKKILAVISRLDSRQIAVITGLQVHAQ